MDTKISNLIARIQAAKGVAAVVIGGSYATGKQRPDSDIDIGIYYQEAIPLDIAALRNIASEFNDTPNPLVTECGVWGKWVNGGAWLIIQEQRVDFIYRNIDFVKKTILSVKTGHIEVDYYQQPAFGFINYIYCGETHICQILYDPYNFIAKLKKEVSSYPPELKKAIYRTFLWDAEFSLISAQKAFNHQDNIVVTACITRIVNDIIQVVYAINETYMINEKSYKQDIESFNIKPNSMVLEIEQIVYDMGTKPTDSLERIKILIETFKILVKEDYQSPFDVP